MLYLRACVSLISAFRRGAVACQVRGLLSAEELAQLRSLCGRCLYHSLLRSLHVESTGRGRVYMATGDIPAEWLRDSAVQAAVLLPRMRRHPVLRSILEGAMRTQVSCSPSLGSDHGRQTSLRRRDSCDETGYRSRTGG